MTTSYPCTNHPRLLLTLAWICAALFVTCLAIVIFVPNELSSRCANGIWGFALLAWWLRRYAKQTYTVDEERSLLIDSTHSETPIRISEIAVVRYKRTWRGRYRCLHVHTGGVRFWDIFMPGRTAVRLKAHLEMLNQNINEKKHEPISSLLSNRKKITFPS